MVLRLDRFLEHPDTTYRGLRDHAARSLFLAQPNPQNNKSDEAGLATGTLGRRWGLEAGSRKELMFCAR